jgi:hypothetical protein
MHAVSAYGRGLPLGLRKKGDRKRTNGVAGRGALARHWQAPEREPKSQESQQTYDAAKVHNDLAGLWTNGRQGSPHQEEDMRRRGTSGTPHISSLFPSSAWDDCFLFLQPALLISLHTIVVK